MTNERADNLMRWVMIFVAQFIVLTLIAMFFYAGGHQADPAATGYSFTRNFFSSLGLTEAFGKPNIASAALFFIAMAGAGLGLILFTLAFPSFCQESFLARWTSRIGSGIGIISGIFFIGVAFTPANLLPVQHRLFVLWGFQLFPLAVLFYIVAILREDDYPNKYAILFAVFAFALVGYIWLLRAGPGTDTEAGLIIQVVGQKIIAYFSLITIYYQAWVARGLLVARSRAEALAPALQEAGAD